MDEIRPLTPWLKSPSSKIQFSIWLLQDPNEIIPQQFDWTLWVTLYNAHCFNTVIVCTENFIFEDFPILSPPSLAPPWDTDPLCWGASLRCSPHCKELQKPRKLGFYMPKKLSAMLAGFSPLDINWQCTLAHFHRLLTSVLLIYNCPSCSPPWALLYISYFSPVTIALHRCWLSPPTHKDEDMEGTCRSAHSLHPPPPLPPQQVPTGPCLLVPVPCKVPPTSSWLTGTAVIKVMDNNIIKIGHPSS